MPDRDGRIAQRAAWADGRLWYNYIVRGTRTAAQQAMRRRPGTRRASEFGQSSWIAVTTYAGLVAEVESTLKQGSTATFAVYGDHQRRAPFGGFFFGLAEPHVLTNQHVPAPDFEGRPQRTTRHNPDT